MKKIFQKFENKNEDKSSSNLSFNASFVGKTFACGAHTVVVEDILAEGESAGIEKLENEIKSIFFW